MNASMRFGYDRHTKTAVSGERVVPCGAMVLSMGLLPAVFAAEPDCVLRYDFDRITHTSKQVKDLSANGNDGLLHGIEVCPGVDGNGIYLDGVDAHVRVPVRATLRQFQAVTLELWAAPENPRGVGGLIWASSHPDPGRQDGAPIIFGQWAWKFGVYLNNSEGKRLTVNPYVGDRRFDIDVLTFPKPTWHHVVVTYDGKTLGLYVNGKLSAKTIAPVSKPLAEITEAIFIGREGQTPGLGGFKHTFTGRVDRVRIHKRALSAQEVAKQYALRNTFKPAPEKPKAVPGTIDGKPFVPFNWGAYRAWKGFVVRSGTRTRARIRAELSSTGHLYIVGEKRRRDLLCVVCLPGQGGRKDFYKHVDACLRIGRPGTPSELQLTGTTYHGAPVKQRVVVTPDCEFKFRYEITIPRKNMPIEPVIPYGMGVGWFAPRRFTGYENRRLVQGRFVDLTRTVRFHKVAEVYQRVGVRGVFRFPPGVVWEVQGHRDPQEFADGTAAFRGRIGRLGATRPTTFPQTEVLELSFQAQDDRRPPVLDPKGAAEITPDQPIDLSRIRQSRTAQARIVPDGRDVPIFGIDEQVRLCVRMPEAMLSRLSGAHYTVTVTDAYTGRRVHQVTDTIPSEWWYWTGGIAFTAPKPSVYIATVRFTDAKARPLRTLRAEVAVAGPVAQPIAKPGEALRRVLVDTVDFTHADPGHDFYSYSNRSRVVNKGGATYRTTLSLAEVRTHVGTQLRDWLGATLRMKHPDRDHVVEVVYADLDDTIIGINVVEPVAQKGEHARTALTRVAAGVITGGVYKADGQLKRFQTAYIPTGRSPWCGVTCANQCENAIGIARINLYEVPGGLPRLERMPSRRLVGVYTESGDVSLGTFGKNELAGESTGDVPRERFYTENYRAIANLIRMLRFRGENLYIYGAYRYNKAVFPSRYVGYPARSREGALREYRFDLDQPGLMAKMFEYNDLKLVLNVQSTCSLPLTRLFRWSNYEMIHGAPVARQVSFEGVMTNGYWHYTLSNPFSPAVQREYERFAEELGERYGPYKSVVGMSWLHGAGGLGEPCVFQWAWALKKEWTERFDRLVFEYTYDDLTMKQFEQHAGVKLPGKAGDPKRFRQRYEWIMKHAKEKWIDFRCWATAQIHKRLSDAFRRKAPGKTYFVIDHGYGATMMANEVPIQRLLELARLSCTDPKHYKGTPGLVYCAYVPQSDGSQCRQHAHGGLPKEWLPRIAEFARDEEFYTACDTGIDCGRYLHRQFLETFTVADAKRPWVLVRMDHTRHRAHHIAHITYPQPAGRNFLADFVQMFAYATPSFITYMWCDGAFPSGHDPQMQAFTRAYRRLPLGVYQTVKRDRGVFVRRGPDAFYVVETEGRASHCDMKSDSIGDGYRNAVTGQRLKKMADGTVRIDVSPYGLDVYVKGR